MPRDACRQHIYCSAAHTHMPRCSVTHPTAFNPSLAHTSHTSTLRPVKPQCTDVVAGTDVVVRVQGRVKVVRVPLMCALGSAGLLRDFAAASLKTVQCVHVGD